ncbi:Nse4 C-terminal-domain-containing protein [Lophiotrema nucula]|uniref:Non-structural maintenance of chromosomes element 4 n=1 Tax=Lophiotrema nucula TaxID=690887 RepID=A0A6A5YJH5_9PLEO|nr:Nse4 C-terminal-domain-containing protein [Lophiotrema nucula]
MARLNTALSATPQPGRGSTVDSLYRDPTPLSQHPASTERGTSYSVLSPAHSMSSDKENREPETRENTPKPVAKRRPMASSSISRLPTPNSGGSSESRHANKRRRTGDRQATRAHSIFEDEDAGLTPQDDDEEDVDEEEEETADLHTPESDEETPNVEEEGDEEEDDFTKYYDPHQNPDVRRQVRANIRNNQRELEDSRDEAIEPGSLVLPNAIKRADVLMGKIRQTADATLDSRFLVEATELSTKKLNRSIHGGSGVGLDIDQFVSKCIEFMRLGGNPADEDGGASTQVRDRRTAATEQGDEEDAGDGLDWAVLGRQACFPSNKRPPVSSFLLGPLSLQKRTRVTQRRQARSQRQPVGPATRPQELTESDMKQSESTNLPNLVQSIGKKLKSHIDVASQRAEEEILELSGDLEEDEEPPEEEVRAACRKYRVSRTVDEGEPCVSLFDFAVNPESFGQTVENLFYVSFLIREGRAKVVMDEDGLPLLAHVEPDTVEHQRARNGQKHQAIFSIDYKTWQTLVAAFDIKEPLIPHRVQEETNVAPGAWYG